MLFGFIGRASLLLSVGLVFYIHHANAETSAGKIICREEISIAHRHILESELQKITGFPTLGFDSHGVLRFDAKRFSGGSESARALLTKAIYGPTTVILEDASRRRDVAFARVIPGRWKMEPRNNSPVSVVLIDFADFDSLTGDVPALKAFDVAWALLHELDHVVEGSEDSTDLYDTGACERHINQMRAECNLPLRADYFHTSFPLSGSSDFKTKLVRLPFVQGNNDNGAKQRYWILWDANIVGGCDRPSIATLR